MSSARQPLERAKSSSSSIVRSLPTFPQPATITNRSATRNTSGSKVDHQNASHKASVHRGSVSSHFHDLEKGVEGHVKKVEKEIDEEIEHEVEKTQKLIDRFRMKGHENDMVPWTRSVVNVVKSSALNVLLLIIPFAWISHFHWKNDKMTFPLCFLSLIPLEKLFDYGGEQLALYTGKKLGDLIVVTLNNTVEATLAILILTNKSCDLRLLQATIIGVVLLHLLLVPGTAFLTGGARIWQQKLGKHSTELNHSLLAVGVLSLLVPTAFFAALDNGTSQTTLVNDTTRGQFLQMSRGIAVILLLVYIASRIFLHNPPGRKNKKSKKNKKKRPQAEHVDAQVDDRIEQEEKQLNQYFCLLFLAVTIAIMALTAEMLVESIDFVRERGHLKEWFGLVLLPIISFSGDGAVAILYFVQTALFLKPKPPAELAKGRAIDLSIQFTLFWMPFLVLLAWWINKPLSLLFDVFEVAVVLGASFLVNYVTADAKTNWAEGFIMVAFYFIIALCSWFYSGQNAVTDMLTCGSVANASAGGDGVVDVLARKLMLRS